MSGKRSKQDRAELKTAFDEHLTSIEGLEVLEATALKREEGETKTL